MIDLRIDRVPEGSYGLRLDPDLGILMPWLTGPALDEIAQWDMADKVVLEWGGGVSTLWWSRRCREVYTIEAHADWCAWIRQTAAERGIGNVQVFERWPDPTEAYVALPVGCRPDIAVVDGSLRTECLEAAVRTFPRPLTVICDNWQQSYVYIDPVAEAMMSDYAGAFYLQSDHTDHDGRPWQTAIWRLA